MRPRRAAGARLRSRRDGTAGPLEDPEGRGSHLPGPAGRRWEVPTAALLRLSWRPRRPREPRSWQLRRLQGRWRRVPVAAASAELHPSSPVRPPLRSPAPKLLPRDKQSRRQGRPPLPLPPPCAPPPRPRPVRAPASELRLQPQPQSSPPGRVRVAARRALPAPARARHFRAAGSAAGSWEQPTQQGAGRA
jgi:hypothetical protein